MNAIGSVINQIDSLVWGWWMIILLLGTHIFMTIRTGVIQRKIGTAIRLSVTKDTNAEGEVSQFGALTTALASTIGTGNIIGVGTAIALGGPGAVLCVGQLQIAVGTLHAGNLFSGFRHLSLQLQIIDTDKQTGYGYDT